jgi:hypothetical protein
MDYAYPDPGFTMKASGMFGAVLSTEDLSAILEMLNG